MVSPSSPPPGADSPAGGQPSPGGTPPAAAPSAPVARVQMYSKSWCPYCERARRLLAHKGVSFEEIDIEVHPERREEMIRRSGRRTVPQIFIGERHIGGSDDLFMLDAVGALDRLLPAASEQAGTTHGQ
jgi:glutaredoxin 3